MCPPSFPVVLPFSFDAGQWLLDRGRFISSQGVYVLLCVIEFPVRLLACAICRVK